MASLRLIPLNASLISKISGYQPSNFNDVHVLDLHLRDDEGKIRKIENLSLVPNLRQLNLSYNAISRMEGLDRILYLVELNLAENSITKIENLESLRSLQKLNLSGNLIERIPENIQLLSRLTHFRIARNKLNNINDIEHLANLRRLSNFRVDENPICATKNFQLFVVFQIMHLKYLDGVEVSEDLKEKALNHFAASNMEKIQNQIIIENHRLARMKRELLQSREREVIEHRDQYSQEIVDKANESIAFKANELKEIEDLIQRLQDVVANNTSPASTEIPIREESSFQNKRLEVNLQSPFSPSPSVHSPKPSTSEPTPHRRLQQQQRQLREEEKSRQSSPPTDPSLQSRQRQEQQQQQQPLNASKKFTDSSFRTSVGRNPQENVEDSAAADYGSPRSGGLSSSLLASKKVSELNSRIEKLTHKLLAAENEKEELLTRLEKYKSNYELMNQDINELDSNLENALIALQSANDENSQLKKEIIQNEKNYAEHEKELKKEMEEKEKKYQQENQDLQDQMNQLQTQLHKNQLNAKESNYEKRYQLEKEKNMKLENQNSEMKNVINHLKSDALHAQNDLTQLKFQNEELEKLKKELINRIDHLENDLDAILKSKRISHANSEEIRSSSQKRFSSLNNNNDRRRASADDNDSLQSDSPSIEFSPYYNDRQSAASMKEFLNKNIFHKRPLSKLEQAAVEVIAATLLEEFEKLQIPSLGSNMKVACIKAAIRMLYTGINVSTVMNEEEQREKHLRKTYLEGDSDLLEEKENHLNQLNISIDNKAIEDFKLYTKTTLLPLKEFGNKKFLTKLVTDAMAGISTYADSNQIKKEIRQLEKVIVEQEKKISSLQMTIQEKESLCKTLQLHSKDAKKQAEDTLFELETLNQRLGTGRDEILKLDSEMNLMKRELEITRTNLKETISLTEIEQKSLETIRDRVMVLKNEQTELENSIHHLKDKTIKEENKIKTGKLMANEQIRMLQTELKKLQNEFHLKQRNIEELDKQQRQLEEELSFKRQIQENSLQSLQQEVDDSHQSLITMKNELRLLQLEKDSLMNKKISIEKDLENSKEKINQENYSFQKLINERQSHVQQLEKISNDLEKKISLYKEKLLSLENEKTILKENIHHSKISFHDYEKTSEEKKSLLNQEINHLSNQITTLNKNYKNLLSNYDQKQLSLQTLLSELRILERKNEEMKRNNFEEEMKYENLLNSNNSLQAEKGSILSEIKLVKDSFLEMKKDHYSLKQQMEIHQKQCIELENKKNLYLSQENHFHENENALKQSIHLLSLQKNELMNEIASKKVILENLMKHSNESTQSKESTEHSLSSLKDEITSLQLMKKNLEFSLQDINKQKNSITSEISSLIKEKKNLEFSIQEIHEKQINSEHSMTLLQENYSFLTKEILSLTKEKEIEKNHLFQLKQEIQESTNKQSSLIHELKLLENQLAERSLQCQSEQFHLKNLEKEKLFLENSLEILKTQMKQDLITKENLEISLKDCLQQSNEMKKDLMKFHENYEKTKNLTMEEQKKYEDQKRLLAKTIMEMNDLESNMKAMNMMYEEQKQKNLKEISLLQNMKQNTQSEFLLLSQAKDKIQLLPTAVSAPSPAAASQSMAAMFSRSQPASKFVPMASPPPSSNSSSARYALARSLPSSSTLPPASIAPATTTAAQSVRFMPPPRPVQLDDESEVSSDNLNNSSDVIELSSLHKAVENLKNRSVNAVKSVQLI